MMAHGMGGQSQGMQRAQPNNPYTNIFNRLVEDMRAQLGSFVNTWQGTYDSRDRANRIMQL